MMFPMHLDPENTFFTSDTHFGHKNIIQFCKRPFETVEIMESKLIEAWNSVVRKDSIVFHLGDFAFTSKSGANAILNKLNGTIILLQGNHDKGYFSSFPFVYDYLEINIENTMITLGHYPILEWNQSHRGSWNLHGHCHGTLHDNLESRRLDVGVDMHSKYCPFSFRQLQGLMKSRMGGPETKHSNGIMRDKYL